MSSSCFAALAKQAPKLLCADCAGLEGGSAVKKEPSLPTLPAKDAAPEPAPDRSERRLADEVLRRQEAEAHIAALQHQLGQISESGRTLERKLQEAPAAEVRPGDATSFQGPHGDLSEVIAMQREICDLQDQLVHEMSKRTDLQLQLDALACHRQVSDQRPLRRAFSEFATPRQETGESLGWTTMTRSESAESWAAGVRTPSEPASSLPGSPTPSFGGWLFAAESTTSRASPLRYATAPHTSRVTASPMRSPTAVSPLRRTWATATQTLPVAGIRAVRCSPTGTSGPFSPASAPHPTPPSRKPALLGIQRLPAVMAAMDM